MGSLGGCLKRLGIHGAEAEYIRSLAKEYREEGFSGIEANTRVAQDLLAEMEREQASVLAQIQDARIKEGAIDATVRSILLNSTTAEPAAPYQSDGNRGTFDPENPSIVAEPPRSYPKTEGQSLFERRKPYAIRENEDAASTYARAKDAIGDLDRAAKDVSSTSGAFPGAGVPARTLGLGISPQFIQDGVIDLTGRQVRTISDLAQLAQVYRDPRFETFRIFYVKGPTIVAHEGITSRLPGFVKVFKSKEQAEAKLKEIQAKLDELGATGYYLLHNHPSGDSRPSPEDFKLTERMAMQLPGFKGHVVIDSGEYTVIDFNADDDLESTRQELPDEPDRLLTPSIEHPLLTQALRDADDVVKLGKQIQNPDGYATVFYRSGPRGAVRAIQEIAVDFLADPAQAAPYLREQAVAFGAAEIITHYKVAGNWTNAQLRLLQKSANRLIEDGVLLDHVVSGEQIGQPISQAEAGMKKKPDHVLGLPWSEVDSTTVAEANPAYARRAAVDIPEPTRLDALIRTLQDKNIDLVRVVDEIKKTHGSLADDLNPVLKEELYMGRLAQRNQDFLTDELRPLVDAMRVNKVSIEELDRYLHARHAQEANAYLKSINPDREENEALSGMTDQEAATILRQASPAMQRLGVRVDTIIGKTRQLMVDYGLETPERITAWEQQYSAYIPLYREGFEERMGTGQGRNIRGTTVKSRVGSTRGVSNILGHIALDREKILTRGEKTRTVVALAGLLKQYPNPELATLARPTTITYHNPETGLEETMPAEVGGFRVPTVARVVKVLDEETGELVRRVEHYPDPSYKGRDNVVNFRLNGQDHAIVFNEHNARAMEIARALKDLDIGQLNGLLQAVAPITRYMASVNTQYNPVFGVVNFVRDVQFAMLALNSTPLRTKKGEVWRNTRELMSGIYKDARAIRRGEHATSSAARLWERFEHVGGPTGYRDIFRTSEDRVKAIRHMLDPDWWQKTRAGRFLTAGGMLGKVESAIVNKAIVPLFEWLSDYNQMMENAVRLGVFKTAVDAGLSDEQAASLAKNITVNFNKKGQIGAQLGAAYAFFNASVQGTARLAETLFEPGKVGVLSHMGKRIVAGGVTLGAVQAVTLALSGFDEEEPPEWLKARSVVIPVPGTDKGYVSFPMPLGFNMIPTVGRLFAEALIYGRPADKAEKALMAMIDTFSPVGGAATPMQVLAPTVLDPMAALAENKDWAGRLIYREDFDKRHPTPGFMRARDTASPWARGLAEALNYATLGTDYVPGGISPSPDAIDYLVGQMTGGVGRETAKASQVATGLVTGEDVPLYKVPLLGRFIGSASGNAAIRDRFYRNLETIQEARAEVKGRQEHGEEVEAYRLDHPEARLAEAANQADRQVRDLSKRRRELIRSGAEASTVRLLDERIHLTMAQINARMEALAEAP